MSIFTGRRKEATAVVRLRKGKGAITVNKKFVQDNLGNLVKDTDLSKFIL